MIEPTPPPVAPTPPSVELVETPAPAARTPAPASEPVETQASTPASAPLVQLVETLRRTITHAPSGLLEAFAAYELALGDDDLTAMDELFADSAETLRGDPGGLLVGHAAIHDFRAVRGGAPARRLTDVRILPLSPDAAGVVAVTAPGRGGRGLQTQLWRRDGDGRWRVAAAHVSPPPVTFDRSVWRVVGDPLAGPTGPGPLDGATVAVKDLFAVAGQAVGAGVPAFLAEAAPEPADSAAVARLRAAGAAVAGIARTDQFAYSLAGDNPWYGTPVNPAVPGGLPGGSSSGSATAVSLGAASIGLATDTAGSVRVPASYQGLWGWRSTHGRVSVAGLLPLAPDFDTVGLLTRDPALLRRAASVLLAPAPWTEGTVPPVTPHHQRTEGTVPLVTPGDQWTEGTVPLVTPHHQRTEGTVPLVTPGDQWTERTVPPYRFAEPLPALEPGVAEAFAAFLDRRLAGAASGIRLPDLAVAAEAVRVHQAFQAWQRHGAWVEAHPDALRGAAGDRFAAASVVTASQDENARATLAGLRAELDAVLGDAVLLLPSAAGPAPRIWASTAEVDAHRQATFRLTCIAGITGRPAVSAPLLELPGGPLGVCLVGPRGSDAALIALAASLAP